MARGLSTLVLAVALGAAACAEAAPPTLTGGSTEAALPASVWPADPTLVAEVDCPDLDPELVLQATVCAATLDGDPVTIDVAIDDVGAATAEIREPLFVVGDAAEQLAQRLADDLGVGFPQVACARTVVVVRSGTTFPCTATLDGRPIDFTVRLLDAGDWTLELDPAQ